MDNVLTEIDQLKLNNGILRAGLVAMTQTDDLDELHELYRNISEETHASESDKADALAAVEALITTHPLSLENTIIRIIQTADLADPANPAHE